MSTCCELKRNDVKVPKVVVNVQIGVWKDKL